MAYIITDPYTALGVTDAASQDDIRKAYYAYQDSKRDDVELFQIIKEAYDILSDPERRRQYDETGET